MLIMNNVLVISVLFLGLEVAAELIPRRLLFGPPKYSAVTISPNGSLIGFLAPNDHGITNVFIKCITCPDAKPITFEQTNHISAYYWTGVPDVIIYSQDNNGDENTKLYKISLSNPNVRHTISDRPGVKAIFIDNDLRSDKMLIALNNESPAFHNVYEFDLNTNEMERIFHNERFPSRIVVDNNRRIRLVTEEGDDGSLTYYRPSDSAQPRNLTSDSKDWVKYMTVSAEDRSLTEPLAFSADNRQIYWLMGENSDLGQLVVHPFGHPTASQVLYQAARSSIADVLFHPNDRTIMAITEFYHKPEIYVANQTIIDDFQKLVNLRPNASPAVTYSNDFNTWLVTYMTDSQPPEYFVYDRLTKQAHYLFSSKPELSGRQLNRMIGFDFTARDGLKLQAYLSLPPKAQLLDSAKAASPEDAEFARAGLLPAEPQKMILLVHGGPKARDLFGFSPMNAWLTDRNYAVMQVNFRGSVGFGKQLINAGNGEWARAMHRDLLDAVEFAVQKGITRRETVAIMGGSHGGFATLVGLTFTPDVFACGVDIVGPSNLISLLELVPPYWLGFYNDLVKMFGADKNTEEGIASLKSRSPLYFADRVRRPLLIIHGSNDPRVRQSESDQFVAELKKRKIPSSYVVFPDEGHGPRKPQNILAMSGIIENFLQQCLHGYAQPFQLGQYNSSAIIDGPVGSLNAFSPHLPVLQLPQIG